MDEFLVIEFDKVIEGKSPVVYLINSEKLQLAKKLAENAAEEWNMSTDAELDRVIESKWRIFHIWFMRIGYVRLHPQYLHEGWLHEKVERISL